MNKTLGIFAPPDGDRYVLQDHGAYQVILKTHDKGTPVAALVHYQGATVALHIGQANKIQKIWRELQMRLK